MCNPLGNECFEQEKDYDNGCIQNCQGFYADVFQRPENSTMVHEEKGFEQLFAEYEIYKNGFEKEWTFSENIESFSDLKGITNPNFNMI